MPGLNSAILLPHNLAQVEIEQSSTVMVLPWVATIRAATSRGAGEFGLTGATGLGGVIGADAPIAAGEPCRGGRRAAAPHRRGPPAARPGW